MITCLCYSLCQIRFYGHVKYNELCQFRSFVMYVSQVLSSWILVTISIDRWIRTRFPYKSSALCTPKKALIVVGILLVLDTGIHAHMLTPLYGMLIPGFSIFACGPTVFSGSYFIFYFLNWTQVQVRQWDETNKQTRLFCFRLSSYVYYQWQSWSFVSLTLSAIFVFVNELSFMLRTSYVGISVVIIKKLCKCKCSFWQQPASVYFYWLHFHSQSIE